ncbi:MAG: glycosyltransferase family protein [Thermodesulfobacteriota bacterium]
MNILALNLSLSKQLKTQGHNVLECKPPQGTLVDVSALCRKANFVPECIIQQEILGRRILLLNLELMSCPKVFWSIDTHLNIYWQRYYARNFDLFLTTQKEWLPRITRAGIKNCAWLPWFGSKQDWIPWHRRKHDISFVGRITETRPTRRWMIEFLRAYFTAHIENDIPFKAMLETYKQTRMAPNEAISGEVNFRTFESASCGALVLSQNLGDGLRELFEPGREIITFENALELKQILTHLIGHPEQARVTAAAGQSRIHREHLPRHRAKRLSDLIHDVHKEKHKPEKNIWTFLASMWLGQNTGAENNPLYTAGIEQTLPHIPETMFFRVQSAAGDQKDILRHLVPLARTNQFDFHLLLNVGCSFAALQAKNLELAKFFLFRYLQSGERRVRPIPDRLTLVRAWVRELVAAGEKMRPGFLYNPGVHLPQSALECLLWLASKISKPRILLPDISNLLHNVPGSEPFVLQAISQLSLYARKKWQYNMDLAQINLKAFRLREGIEELILARENAFKAGEEKHFLLRLRRLDKKSLLHSALDEVIHA